MQMVPPVMRMSTRDSDSERSSGYVGPKRDGYSLRTVRGQTSGLARRAAATTTA